MTPGKTSQGELGKLTGEICGSQASPPNMQFAPNSSASLGAVPFIPIYDKTAGQNSRKSATFAPYKGKHIADRVPNETSGNGTNPCRPTIQVVLECVEALAAQPLFFSSRRPASVPFPKEHAASGASQATAGPLTPMPIALSLRLSP